MVTPGMVPLSISRLNASDIRCSRTGESPSDSGLAWGRGGVCGAAACLAAVCAVMVSLPLALVVVAREVWRRIRVEQGFHGAPRNLADAHIAVLNRALTASPLQSGPWPMLETARIGGDAWFLQGCSSVGRVPVSKTGCRRFEPCRPCQQVTDFGDRSGVRPEPPVPAYLDLWPRPQYIAATCCRPALTDIRRGFEIPRTIEPACRLILQERAGR